MTPRRSPCRRARRCTPDLTAPTPLSSDSRHIGGADVLPLNKSASGGELSGSCSRSRSSSPRRSKAPRWSSTRSTQGSAVARRCRSGGAWRGLPAPPGHRRHASAPGRRIRGYPSRRRQREQQHASGVRRLDDDDRVAQARPDARRTRRLRQRQGACPRSTRCGAGGPHTGLISLWPV